MRKIEVLLYDPIWPLLYHAEAARLVEVFGPELVAIHHIGSTAVPGLAAKPTIDILAEVHDVTSVDALNPRMTALGYEPRGEFGIPGRRYFLRLNGEIHTHHVHVFQAGNPEPLRHLSFRDYLITHPDEAKAYGKLKRELAERFSFDIAGYMDGKDAFIKTLERRALDWKEASRAGATAATIDGRDPGKIIMGITAKEPFWEAAYRDPTAPSAFGAASEEIIELLPKLIPGSAVLDLGCGDGRNALLLLEKGMIVTAIDISQNAISKLKSKAIAYGDRVRANVIDVRNYIPEHQFDMIIAHGILHLLPRPDWSRLIMQMKETTKPAGFNIVAVFTDSLPPPKDLVSFMPGLFHEGELLEQYTDWKIEVFHSHILEDEHPGSVRHRHPVNKIVARKPI